MFEVKVKNNFKPLKKFVGLFTSGSRFSRAGSPFREMLEQWGERYLAYAQDHFLKASRGGADWAQLKPATIRQRRKGKGSGKPSILYDTGMLFRGLSRGHKGNRFDIKNYSVIVGYGGRDRIRKGKITIKQLAEIHNMGKGHVPKRQIIIKPNSHLINKMRKDAYRATQKALQRYSIKGV